MRPPGIFYMHLHRRSNTAEGVLFCTPPQWSPYKSKRQGKIPRYAEFINVDQNGDYAYREGYHKLLVDFKMFDADGNILPQGDITPDLNDGFMAELLNAEIDRKKNYQFPQEVYDAIDKQFGEQYSSHDYDDTLDSHQDLTQDIYYPKTAREMSVFNRQYINKTNGLKPGKIRYITIYTGSNVYAVRACGTDGLNPYIGKIISNESLENYYLSVAGEELRYGFDENRKRNDSPSDEIRYNRRRGNVSYRSVKERLKAEGYDYLLEDEP